MEANKLENNLITYSVQEFAVNNQFISLVPTVRVNENGYPYITFIDVNNKAENIYFSKESSKAVAAGTVVDKQLLTNYQIGITTNAAGEKRTKLVSNSNRVDIASLFM